MEMLFVLLFCICFANLIPAQDVPGFISIDCGAAEPTDSDIGLSYKTDEGFIHSGQKGQVAPEYNNQKSLQLRTLRSFPDGVRNCYTLRPNQSSSNRYLIRASFFYGNYDGLSQTPVFGLYIDVNYWTTVTWNDTFEEVVYTTSRDYVHVCLVKTGSGIPYISALELRTLDNSTYNTMFRALENIWRFNVGSSIRYRYPEDVYDRIWVPIEFVWNTINTTDVSTLRNRNNPYKVPAEVLMTAQEQSNSSLQGMEVSWTSRTPSSKWYAFMHFAEVRVLPEGQARQLQVYVNGDISVANFTPQYLEPVTISTSSPFDGTNLSFSILSASNFSAFINAVEIFRAIDLPTSQTDLNNVNAMNDIMKEYGVFRGIWQGDPCAPWNFIWRGLTCSQDNSPKITSLNMSSSGLTGAIVTSFSNLTSLEILDLSFNELSGPLPEFLASMPKLRILNLGHNNLSGLIPEALIRKNLTDNAFRLSLDGNPNLCVACTPAPSPSDGGNKKKNSVPAIVGVASAIFVLAVISVIVGFCIKRKRRQGGNVSSNTGEVAFGKHESKEATKSSSQETSSKDSSIVYDYGTLKIMNKNRTFTSVEVSAITNNFKVILGEGGFGNVYLGTLKEGTRVAVKVLSPSSRQGYKEFRAEAQLLMMVHHKNLVSLVGYCDEVENLCLIYEFMSNGDLRQHLAEHSTDALSWIMRLQVGTDAALGLEYLHNGCTPPIVHRDLKTTNILLNDKMQAKISDFGLSRAFATDMDSHISTRPAGTPGYLDPEFHMTGNLNTKSDVYSFGVIMLELITGRPAIIRDTRGSTHIVHWVNPFIGRGDIQSILDPRIWGQFDINSAWKFVEIALQCVRSTATQRPDMSSVLSELKECLAIQTRYTMRQAMESGDTTSGSFEMTSLEINVAPRSR
ncbi:hypothetical protein SAY87_018232 [Trapa incisa]|uniref:non-specific serine/threonine protein kinase n=1 Tax=Trapa incisa TaxID=236973 RepID=A0AAN7LAE6_9MYRT|nr:hypothetical protein SAY87_018232 [Trapa incisa]